MDFDSLRCFTAAADTLNFRAAAKQVGLSPGAFSDRIRRLEEELGTRLFDRTTRRAHLTAPGHRLLPHAMQLLADIDACRRVANTEEANRPYTLTVGTRYELGVSWLAPALTDLRLTRPNRRIHLNMGDSPELLERTRNGTIDATVTSSRLADGTLRYATLHAEDYAFVGTSQEVDGPDDVRDLTLVDISEDLPLFRYLLDALPDGRPWPFAHHAYMGGIAAIRVRVLAGDGVAVLPRYFIQPDIDARRVRELLPGQPLHRDAFRLVWRAHHPLEEALLELAEELRGLPLK
ncbi:MAG: LysR family transcriptional regulator [Myxococcales bacterium]|nr:LysR family transcriptional regulator [Myxococcales bacterium]MCA9570271.1 LysR family transcriptional regulator [Myxococcales bacterium]MCB9672418.1 LysR family transcriptional regulator [Alphaproteobacteria bacterium]MCB9693075.1 LysR family transcriptional regulator [Alphaproteobacteria bacterium]